MRTRASAADRGEGAISVGVWEFSRRLSELLKTVETSQRPVLITRHDRPVAMLVPAQGPVYEDYRRGLQQRLTTLLQHLSEEQSP